MEIMDAGALTALDDASLIAHHSHLSAERTRIDAALAESSAELARRSHHSLGHAGLAQRLGARTPQRLVQQLSGVSKGEASLLVRAGSLREVEPWAASVSIGAADAISRGLGAPTSEVPASMLAGAAETLVAEASSLTLEQLTARAREERDCLDEQHVLDRERQLYEARYLRISQRPDGALKIDALLDPESGALVRDAFDIMTSPRGSGPSFADPLPVADPRTREQLMADGLVAMVRLAAGADPAALFGDSRPAVRILVDARDLERGAGSGQLEGQAASVSIETVQRHICATGSVAVVFGADGQPINVGRTQRLFTSAQRLALSARDGGCRFTGCDRPPSWSEAHHIVPWSRGGPTDIANGILLCRHHHLLVHNNGWGITRHGSDYFLEPPGGGDRIPMPSRSRVFNALRRSA
jgi:hypothetical protein